MTTRPSPLADLDRQERAALEALGLDPDALDRPPTCPEPALLVAAADDVLSPEVADGVRRHAAGCAYCSRLTEALGHVYDEAAALPSAAVDRRVRGASAPAAHGGWRWAMPLGGLAFAASAAWAFLAGVSQVATPPVPPVPTAWPTPATSLPRSVFVAGRPSIPVADLDLVFRGEAAPATSPADVASEALELASRGRLDEAVAQLGQASRRYPEAAEVALALGALLLEQGETQRAVATLEPARQRGRSALRSEVEWYLAVGYARSGGLDRAAALLVPLCEGGGPRSAVACAGLDEIAAGRAER